MRRKAGWVLAAAVAAAMIGCAETPRRGTTFVGNEVLGKVGLDRYWELSLGLSPGQTIARMVLLEENLYCFTNDNVMIAVDAARGVRKWTRDIGGNDTSVQALVSAEARKKTGFDSLDCAAEGGRTLGTAVRAPASRRVFAPCHGTAVRMTKELPGVEAILHRPQEDMLPVENVVIVNTSQKALVLSRESGEVLREINFGLKLHDFVANTGGACDGTYYYVGSNDGRVLAYHLNTLTVAWVLYSNKFAMSWVPYLDTLSIFWATLTPEVLWAAPRVQYSSDTMRIYVAGGDGHLYALRAGDALTQLWPPEMKQGWPAMSSDVVAPLVVDNRAAFVPSVQRRVFAFPLKGGEPLWKFTAHGNLLDPIQVSEHCVYQYARGDKLYALDPTSGQPRWSLAEGRRVLAAMPAAQGPSAFLLDNRGNLLLVDEVLGKVRASVPLTNCNLYADNTSAPAVYVGNRGGQLYCLRQAGAEHMTVASLKKGTGGKAVAATTAPATRPAGTKEEPPADKPPEKKVEAPTYIRY